MLGVLPRIYSSHRLGLTTALLALLGLVPVLNIATHVVAAARNIAYWDEFETALTLLLQLDASPGLASTLAQLFEVSNEHRMVTSRLLFAASYWLTGTVNFNAISAIGNAFLVALCALLVWSAGTTARRLQLGLPLAFLLFQLEHYENFLWSGSSIDHFQVVLLAAGAVVGVARGTRLGLLAGGLCALLGTFTLAHGLLAWPIGALMLWRERRRDHFLLWNALACVAIAGFAVGFRANAAHSFAGLTPVGIAHILGYWLKLLGAAPALGNDTVAPVLGVGLLAALGFMATRGALRREKIALPLACFAIAALALIAIGRAEASHGIVQSRYLVLGALAWALVIFMALARWTHPRHPYALLLRAVPLLAVFNLAANDVFASKAASWAECRDRAALAYKQHGRDGRGTFWLYPHPERATALLGETERRGLYRLPPVCTERTFPRATPSSRITYFVDELSADARCAFVTGWAAIPGLASRRGTVHLVLRSATAMHVFTTVTTARPDVVSATKKPEWELCGFRFARLREGLPSGEFQVGFLIAHADRKAEFIMTDHRLQLIGRGKALLATAD